MKLTPSKRTNKTPTKSDRVDHPKISIECDFNVYRNSANSLIYLNNADFTALALQAGSLISLSKTINNPTIKAVARVWPDKNIPSKMIALPSYIWNNIGVDEDDSVYITGVDLPVIEALRLTLVLHDQEAVIEMDNAFNEYVKETMLEIAYFLPDTLVEIIYCGKPVNFLITSIENEDCKEAVYQVTNITEINIDKLNTKSTKTSKNKISYSNIGGLDDEIKTIKEMVDLALKFPNKFKAFGIQPPKGILLYGPSGTGKSMICKAVGNETVGANVIVINGPEFFGKSYGESEANLREIFQEATDKSPSIILIDEIDSICPKRDDSSSESDKRIVATLLTLMDGISGESVEEPPRMIILATTSKPDSLDDALRRPGRFDREIEIGIPNPESRLQILQSLLKNTPHSLTEQQLLNVATSTHAYVGADLAAIIREAGMYSIKKGVDGLNFDLDKVYENIEIGIDDVEFALGKVKPSAMREIMLEVPKVLWSDIGGQEDVKQRLREAVEWPLTNPESFSRFNIQPPKGILLYGPPGCSKTLMAKALATEGKINFIAVKGPELFSKYVGDSEKAVREVFRKARSASPSIIFFDEIDAVAVKRGNSGDGGSVSVSDRVLSQLLAEMDGIQSLVNVTIVAATNRPDIIDSALLRPGRIDRILYVGPPDLASRTEILRIRTNKMAIADNVYVHEVAAMCEGFSGAEVCQVCQEAALIAMEEDINAMEVGRSHFQQAVNGITPRITPAMISTYMDYKNNSKLASI